MRSKIVTVVLTLGLLVWMFGSGRIVGARAEEHAAGRPYCLQVPDDRDFKPAGSLRELSALSMWGIRGSNHGVLVVGDVKNPEFLHWSYWSQDFEPDALGPPAIFCTPVRHFVSSLGKARPPGPDMQFYLADRLFSIPRAYRPSVQTMQRKYGITMFAVAPDFDPLPGPLRPGDFPLDYFVQVVFQRHAVYLDPTEADPRQGRTVEEAGQAFGLQKRIVRSSTSRYSTLEYLGYGADGRVTTNIGCGSEPSSSCAHVFERHGWTYRYRLPASDVEHWREREGSLSARTESFVRRVDP